MRVYSKSQGKFIDMPDKGVTNVATETGDSMGLSSDTFKEMALMDLLTGGKHTTQIKATSDMFSNTQGKKDATNLRKEFSTETKNLGFQELQNSWQKVQSAPTTGAGDLTIVYSYIKALDPTTAVREGEINLTKAAESIPGNIIRAYKRAKEGQVISPELRQEMIGEIGRMYNERAKKQQELNAFYSGLASDSGVDPNDVIGKVGEIKFAEIPEVKQQKKRGLIEQILTPEPGSIEFAKKMVSGAPEVQPQGNLEKYFMPAYLLKHREQIAPLAQDVGEYMSLFSLLKGAPKAVSGIKGGTKNLIDWIKQGGFRGVAGRGRDIAGTMAQETSGGLSGDQIVQSLKSQANELSGPLKKSVLKEIQTAIPEYKGKAIDINKSIEIFKNSPAFTKGGDVRTTGAGYFYDFLRNALKQEWSRVAPNVLKQTDVLRKTYEIPRQIGKTTRVLGSLGMGAGGLGYLANLLFGEKR